MNPQKKQKLLIVITKSNFGGAQRYVYDLSRSLKGRYDIAVVCGGNGMLVDMLAKEGVRTIALSSLSRNVNILKDVRSFFALAGIMRHEKPDVVHLNSSKIGGIGSVIARIFAPKARIIFTAHAWAFNEDRSTLSKWVISGIHWLTVMLAHRTISVSAAVKRQMSHLPFMDKKISVVHLGLENFEPLSRAEARAKLNIKEPAGQNGLVIGTVAELHPVKGLGYALEAIKDTSAPCTYTIIGDGELKKQLETKIASDSALESRATLAGFVTDAAKYISAFDIFLLPSLSEAFGYVLLEAGYCNVSVIATSVGGIPEIIEDMKSGILIHAKNPKEIKSSIEFLAENAATRDNLAAELNQKVRTEFSLSKMVEKTVEVYNAR